MKTRQALSPVSYNTEEFLKSKLNELLENRRIDFWCYIKHKGEIKDDYIPIKDDFLHVIEVTSGQIFTIDSTNRNKFYDKDHIHLYLHNAGTLDTMELDDFLKEPVSNSDKPLRTIFDLEKNCICRNFSKWYWYVLHNPRYCKSKNLVKQFTYDKSDFVYSDYDLFERYASSALSDPDIRADLILFEKYINGVSLDSYEVIAQGYVDLKKSMQLNAFDRIRYRHVQSGRDNYGTEDDFT